MIIKRNLAWLSTSLALTVVVASPSIADDTELLLQTAMSGDKPNILFILDTSGSMNTLEHTIAFYDSAADPYTGSCDNTVFYWSDTGSPPACDANRAIAKSNFVCDSADTQVDGIGSYTGVVAQYRAGTAGGSRWQTLSTTAAGGIVECAADSGIHGDGIVSTDLYARAGTDVSEFTSNPDEEIDWESFPTNVTYTLYDGNYLNWRQNPGEADITRIDIVKTVLKKVLSAYDEVNLALMRFNNVDGGSVIHAMSDLEVTRASLNAKLDAITAVGNTPLSETFYEAALYWQGLPAHYGELISEHATDPAALSSSGPEIYQEPLTVAGSCPRNFNILLSDGLPHNDLDTELLAPTLPGWEAALGRTVCDDFVAEGDCLDDISEYLSKHDINTTETDDQFVKTFSVGFLAPQDTLDLMRETAEVTGGEFFIANDPDSLAVSLLKIFEEVTEQSLTFTSPAVAVNAFNRTRNLNDLYMTVFETSNKAHWPGNLKKYRISDSIITDANDVAAVDPATGFFEQGAQSFWSAGTDGADVTLGGAANILPDPAVRKVYTNNTTLAALTADSNTLTESSDTFFVVEDFGLTGSAGEPTIAEMIRWANGEDVRDADGDPTTTKRNEMGDPLHSQPAAVDYGTGGVSDIIVFTATNDGYLHAIDSTTGVDLWSFVPKEMLVNFAKLFNDPTEQFKQYGIDGDITPIIFDEDGNGQLSGNDFVYIVFGLRRGGSSYYVLDVTDPATPVFKWQFAETGFGQTWSTPVAARINFDTGERKVMIVGGGYDTAHDSPAEPLFENADGEGAGIYMFDVETGDLVWRAGRDSLADLELAEVGTRPFYMNRAFPTAIKVIDINGDSFADRMYAADVGGQIWRFDIFQGQTRPNLVTGGVIAQFGFEGPGTPASEGPRRIYNSPDVSIFTDPLQNRRFLAINIGTGYRAHPLNTNAVDRFFSLRDKDIFNQLSQTEYDNYDIATDDPTDGDMVEVSGATKTVIDSDDRGWQFTLPATQMILAEATTFDDAVFFVAFSPEATSAADCEQTFGKNFLYEVSVVNGDPIVDNIDAIVPSESDAARGKALPQGGIAASATFLFPTPDLSCTGDGCAPPPIGCVGTFCFEPGFKNNLVRTLWTQDGIE